MANSRAHDIGGGSGLSFFPARLGSLSVTAAGAGDATSATGLALDTSPQTLGRRYNSAVLGITNQATMASGATMVVNALIETSTNNSDWTTLRATSAAYTHTATGGALTAAQSGGQISVDLSKASRYLRATLNPDMSSTGTDTAVIMAVWALAHPDRVG